MQNFSHLLILSFEQHSSKESSHQNWMPLEILTVFLANYQKIIAFEMTFIPIRLNFESGTFDSFLQNLVVFCMDVWDKFDQIFLFLTGIEGILP